MKSIKILSVLALSLFITLEGNLIAADLGRFQTTGFSIDQKLIKFEKQSPASPLKDKIAYGNLYVTDTKFGVPVWTVLDVFRLDKKNFNEQKFLQSLKTASVEPINVKTLSFDGGEGKEVLANIGVLKYFKFYAFDGEHVLLMDLSLDKDGFPFFDKLVTTIEESIKTIKFH